MYLIRSAMVKVDSGSTLQQAREYRREERRGDSRGGGKNGFHEQHGNNLPNCIYSDLERQ